MRIMLVTYRYGMDIAGGGERYLRELMIRLAERGHEVEVYSTCSRQMILSPLSYLVWDNLYPEGEEEDSGVLIHRFRVLNPRPRKARKISQNLNQLQERERESNGFVSIMSEALEGFDEHCFLSGWHNLEMWQDGPARWTMGRADLIVGGSSLRSLTLEAYPYLSGPLLVEMPGRGSWEFELEKGKPRKLDLEFQPCRGAAVRLRVPRTTKPRGDDREVGIAVRQVKVEDDGRERDLDLARGWGELLDNGPEEVIGKTLWGAAGERPRRSSRWHKYLFGPRSPGLERGVADDAHRFDIIFGSMVPMVTMEFAGRAALQAGKPLVAFPLFHTRDPNHYWFHFKEALQLAAGVEANSPVIAELMRNWGFKAFAVGPGFDLDEFSSREIDGDRFRRDFGFGEGPLLLWVARKNVYKGYREAISALSMVRDEGFQASLAMIGPDEDYLPVSGEGVYYLGAKHRSTVLDAFDACDVFIFPSLHESFCLVFCEAWLRGKPVLGNAFCAAARGLIDHGVDGYLCASVEEYGLRTLELLRDRDKAGEMGERGRRKVLDTRGWEQLVERLEGELAAITGNRGGRP